MGIQVGNNNSRNRTQSKERKKREMEDFLSDSDVTSAKSEENLWKVESADARFTRLSRKEGRLLGIN
jgi:hypothetical protein